MKKKGTLFVGLIAMILLLIVILLFNWQRVEKEREVEIGVVEILNSENYTGLEVNTTGLGGTVSLAGTMRSQESVNHVVSLIKKLDGVSSVDTHEIVLKPLLPATFSLRANNQAITLLGTTSSESAASQFKTRIEELTGMPVDHGISFDSEVEAPEWLDALAAVLPALFKVEALKVDVQNKVLQVSGISRDEAEYQAIVRGIQSFEGIDTVDTSGLILTLREPAWFSFGEGELTGIFASKAEAARLEDTLSNLMTVEVNQNLQVDETVAEAKWLEDLERLDVSAQALENAIVSYRDDVMHVSGVIRTQEVFDNLASKAPDLVHVKQLNLSKLLLRPLQPPWIQLDVNADKLVLAGRVRETAVADALIQSVMESSRTEFSGTVENQLRASKDFLAAKWSSEIQRLIPGIVQTEKGSLGLRDGVLSISGVVRDVEIFDQIKTFSSSFGQADQIEIAQLNFRPWKTPKFAVSTFGTKAVVSGRVGEEKAAKLLAEATGLVFGDDSSTQVLVDPDVIEALWLNSVIQMMPAMTGLENASLTATSEGIELGGIARTEESYELVTKALKEVSAQGVNNLVTLQPWLQPTLELISDGKVLQSAGALPSEIAVEQLNAQLERLAEAKNLTHKSTVDVSPNIETTDWLPLVTQAISGLSVLELPGMQVSDGIMTVMGRTSDQALADSIVSDISEAIEGLRIESEVAYIPPLEVQSGAGDAIVEEVVTKEAIDQCEQRLDAQMEGKRIEFASSSALISENSSPILLSLLQELKDCPEVLIEVSGHTDSSGNNASNLVLSEQRAQAVVDYLVSAGVPESRLQARGYGSDQPVAGNETIEGRAENRRIEFNIK